MWGWGWGAAQRPPLAFVTLALYPLWGLVQQGILQGVVVRGLAASPWLARRPAWVTLLAAAAFGLAHLSHPALVAQGWLGTVLFTWVLGREPVSEFFLGG